MIYGSLLERYLKHFGQARVGGSMPAFTERANLAHVKIARGGAIL